MSLALISSVGLSTVKFH